MTIKELFDGVNVWSADLGGRVLQISRVERGLVGSFVGIGDHGRIRASRRDHASKEMTRERRGRRPIGDAAGVHDCWRSSFAPLLSFESTLYDCEVDDKEERIEGGGKRGTTLRGMNLESGVDQPS